MSKIILFCVSLFILASFVTSCGKDDKTDTPATTENVDVSQFIVKDSITGKDKVKLRYNVKKGDKFAYHMIAKTSTSENSPATENKDVQQDNEINYYYNKEVSEIDQNGIISYKVLYDSINITASMDNQKITYSSNVDDSVKKSPAFIQYNAVVGEPFFIRVSPEGDITDVYGLETIYENLFKALGDTLNEQDKNTVRESFGKESIREILQQEYQVFPKNEVIVDSSWVKTYNTNILVFDLINNAKYILKGIEQNDGKAIANIEAVLNVEFKNKEAKEQGITVRIVNSETGGSGNIKYDMGRGCIVTKDTQTTLNLDLHMSAQGQSAKTKQRVATNLSVRLLN